MFNMQRIVIIVSRILLSHIVRKKQSTWRERMKQFSIGHLKNIYVNLFLMMTLTQSRYLLNSHFVFQKLFGQQYYILLTLRLIMPPKSHPFKMKIPPLPLYCITHIIYHSSMLLVKRGLHESHKIQLLTTLGLRGN